MGEDLIANLLDKLSKQTGREWTMGDLLRLAEKLPESGDNVDAVLQELSEMGVNVSEGMKEKVKQKLEKETPFSLNDQDELPDELLGRVRKSSFSPSRLRPQRRKKRMVQILRRVKKPKKRKR